MKKTVCLTVFLSLLCCLTTNADEKADMERQAGVRTDKEIERDDEIIESVERYWKEREQEIAAALAATKQIKFTAAEQAETDRFCAAFGSDVKAVDKNKETLLHKAVDTKWSLAVIKFLISKGADVNAIDVRRFTPLHLAVGHNNKDVAVGKKNLEITKFLVSVGADVNAQTGGGFTPLHLAASNVHVEIVKFLVDNGADVNATNNAHPVGNTPLDLAKKANNTAVIEYLADIGAQAKGEQARVKRQQELAERQNSRMSAQDADANRDYQPWYGNLDHDEIFELNLMRARVEQMKEEQMRLQNRRR